jgi:hypothetical protein
MYSRTRASIRSFALDVKNQLGNGFLKMSASCLTLDLLRAKMPFLH